MPTKWVRVLRPFGHEGERIERGQKIELPRGLALQLVADRKAELIDPQEPAKAQAKQEAMPAKDEEGGKSPGGKKDAGKPGTGS